MKTQNALDSDIRTSDTEGPENTDHLEREAARVMKEIQDLMKPFGSTEEANIIMGKMINAKLLEAEDEFHLNFLLQYFRPLIGYLKDAEKPLSASGYRVAPKDETKIILEKFSEFQHSGESPGEPLQSMETFTFLETETWLDIAFIQAAMHQSALTTAGVENASEVAQLLFGEDSRLAKRMQEFKQAGKYEDLRSGILFLYGAVLLALETSIVVLGAKLGAKLEPIFVVLLALATAMAAMMMAFGIHKYRNPYPGTRKYLRNRYGKMKVPQEAQRFTDIAFSMKDCLKKLQNSNDETERIAMLQELTSLADEAKASLQKNSEMFKAKANKTDPTSFRRKKPDIRIEEFETERENPELPPAQENNDEISGLYQNEIEQSIEEEMSGRNNETLKKFGR